MKTFKTLTLIGALSAVALTATAASAQPRGGWMPINQRQAALEQRIDAGVRHGDLSRHEARELRVKFDRLAQLEGQYRINGLTPRERADLDRRFDQLASQIHAERHDRRHG